MLKTESSTTTASVRVMETVADATALSTLELPPLYESIDPESLDTLVATAVPGSEVSFEYFDFDVTVAVEADGEVAVRLQ